MLSLQGDILQEVTHPTEPTAMFDYKMPMNVLLRRQAAGELLYHPGYRDHREVGSAQCARATCSVLVIYSTLVYVCIRVSLCHSTLHSQTDGRASSRGPSKACDLFLVILYRAVVALCSYFYGTYMVHAALSN